MMLKVVGLNVLQRKMVKRQGRLKNLKKANTQALAIVDRWIQKNFEGEGKLAMGGTGWRKLSPATLHARAMGYGNYKHHRSKNPRILQDTGDLKTKWRHVLTARTAKLQSQRDYGSAHHEGKGNLPTRRILPLDRQIRPKLIKHFEWFKRQALH